MPPFASTTHVGLIQVLGAKGKSVAITETLLQQMRAVAISAAGLCSAIVLVVFQIGLSDCASTIALYSASLGIPAWIVAWQYIQAHLIFGAPDYARYDPRTARNLVWVAGPLLLLSIAALIWHLSPCAAGIFSASCLFSLILVRVNYRHAKS